MKTPHRITLQYGETEKKFDPVVGDYVGGEVQEVVVPCLVNHMTKRKQFEDYGSRNLEIISVRFVNEVAEFDRAIYNGEIYKMYEENYVPRKKAVRLQKVVE